MNNYKSRIASALAVIGVLLLMTGAVWSSGERIVRKETEAAIEEMQKQAENRQEEAASGTESKDSAADTTDFCSNTPTA